ncbi:hypothetical protein GCM10009067_41430 [Haloarcula sebkhae]|uniref:Uncharacterized protein n=1 Tax=Haloarcula sebkhae TaxID=932660 RepID=A0A830EXG1_9EURY|nr:hypothetical protein GCM10009067_41430 [Haloarcula sebkhae]
MTPPQAAPFLIVRDGDEFRTRGSGVGEQEDECGETQVSEPRKNGSEDTVKYSSSCSIQ